MRSIITGGAGFIGSWLCESLLNEGHEVISVDNFITGSEKNISHLRKNKSFRLIRHDVSKPMKIASKIDYVFHLASPASPVHYQKHPIETMLANSAGTYNMLELARKNSAKFMFASTSEVYGNPKEHPQKETYWGNVNPVGPRSCYDESKRFGEALVMSFQRGSLDARIVRIFNTYGPRMQSNDGRAVPNFINQAIRNKPITIYGSGKQTRSFCYVTDMVSGIKKAMFSGNRDIINLGNPEESTILEIAKRIKSLSDSGSEIIFKPLPADDPIRRKPDITRAKKTLKWEPKTKLDAGLKETIEWFKEVF